MIYEQQSFQYHPQYKKYHNKVYKKKQTIPLGIKRLYFQDQWSEGNDHDKKHGNQQGKNRFFPLPEIQGEYHKGESG